MGTSNFWYSYSFATNWSRSVDCVLSMLGKIMTPMCRLWLHGLYGPWCQSYYTWSSDNHLHYLTIMQSVICIDKTLLSYIMHRKSGWNSNMIWTNMTIVSIEDMTWPYKAKYWHESPIHASAKWPPGRRCGHLICYMSNKAAAKCKVDWNSNFEAKYLKNYMKSNHRNLNRD